MGEVHMTCSGGWEGGVGGDGRGVQEARLAS